MHESPNESFEPVGMSALSRANTASDMQTVLSLTDASRLIASIMKAFPYARLSIDPYWHSSEQPTPRFSSCLQEATRDVELHPFLNRATVYLASAEWAPNVVRVGTGKNAFWAYDTYPGPIVSIDWAHPRTDRVGLWLDPPMHLNAGRIMVSFNRETPSERQIKDRVMRLGRKVVIGRGVGVSYPSLKPSARKHNVWIGFDAAAWCNDGTARLLGPQPAKWGFLPNDHPRLAGTKPEG